MDPGGCSVFPSCGWAGPGSSAFSPGPQGRTAPLALTSQDTDREQGQQDIRSPQSRSSVPKTAGHMPVACGWKSRVQGARLRWGWRTQLHPSVLLEDPYGLCERCKAGLPVGPFVTAGRMSWAESNYFPIPRMVLSVSEKEKKDREGGKNSSVCLSVPLSAFYPSLYVSVSIFLSLCLYPCPFVCLCILCFLDVCLNLSISVPLFQSLLVSVALLSLSSLSPTPFPLPSFLVFFPSSLPPSSQTI